MPCRLTVNEKAAQAWALMKARSWDLHDLARATGLTFDAVRFIFYRYQASPRRAWKIERALGAPVWTDAHRYRQLVTASKRLGLDFVLTDFQGLRRAAVAVGVAGTRRVTNKATLLLLVLASNTPISSHEKAAD